MKYSRSDIAKGFVIQADKNMKRAIRELASLILEERLHSEIDEIISDIAEVYFRTHGIVEAEVKTAYKLSSQLKKELEVRVKQETGAKKVNMHEIVDSTLLAGVIVNAPDMELDLSLRSKLARIQRGSI